MNDRLVTPVFLALAVVAALMAVVPPNTSADHQHGGHQTFTGNYLSFNDAIGQEVAQNLGPGARGREVAVLASATAYSAFVDKAIGNWNAGTATQAFFRNDGSADPDVFVSSSSTGCAAQLNVAAVVRDETAACGNFGSRSNFTMPDSNLDIYPTKSNGVSDDATRFVGMTHEFGHTLGIADHYPTAAPGCRNIPSIMENWGCSATTVANCDDPTPSANCLMSHDKTDFEWAYRITADVSRVYLHPAGSPGHGGLVNGVGELHFDGASNIHNESRYVNESSARASGSPAQEFQTAGPNTAVINVLIPSASLSNNNVGICKRVRARAGAYGTSDSRNLSPASRYSCIKYGENLSAAGTKPKYYVETDTVGNTVFVYVYNLGTQSSQRLYNVNVYTTGAFNLRCSIGTVLTGSVGSCAFSSSSDGTVDVWSLNVGTSTSGKWSAINTLDFDR